MPNADTTLIDRAEEAGVSLATYTETRQVQHRGVRHVESPREVVAKRFEGCAPQSFDGFPRAESLWRHVPGDITTPPAPGAIWIGSGDA
ncbi:hypothetical protein CEY09_14625 [Achromobacter marplatensis]|uniref:Uncharacterized protein n=2 Tax=Achromobacter marplatensis TaxID=470868 RepID=A0ABX9GDN6_9BURK|nr:hypothetical protein CEY09_14625 [Achromobacter marplatensis]RBP19794.1 hypothetical protein DFP87_104129 [Achromobacter marplatensis]CAB3637065.1 hypothetical protein LMG26219_01759 [Achromobacter marplatensis]